MSGLHESRKKIAFIGEFNESGGKVVRQILDNTEAIIAVGQKANYGKLNNVLNPLINANAEFAKMVGDFQTGMKQQAEILATAPAAEVELKTEAKRVNDAIVVKTMEFAALQATGMDEDYDTKADGAALTTALEAVSTARLTFIQELADNYKKNATEETKTTFQTVGKKAEEGCNDFVRILTKAQDAATEVGINVAKMISAMEEAANALKGGVSGTTAGVGSGDVDM